MSVGSSHCSAALINESAACCGLSKVLELETEAAGAVGAEADAAGASFTAGCWPVRRAGTGRDIIAIAETTQASPRRFLFEDVDFISLLLSLSALPAPTTTST